MLVKVKKLYRKLPLGIKLKIRKYVLLRNNSTIKIKGSVIAKNDVKRIEYNDGKLFDGVNRFSKNYINKTKKNTKFNLVNTYTEYRKLPLEDDTILLETFHGKSMTDNPYALFLEILNRPDAKQFKFVWVLNHASATDIQAKRFDNMDNIHFVKVGSQDYIKYLATARYLINNTSFPPYFIRRSEQKYLNTWHGTPLKTLGKDMKGSVGQHKNLSRNFLQATHILSPNEFTGEILVKSHDIDGVYQGKIIEEGYPRVDLITNTSDEWYKKEILNKILKIDKSKKIALYAPTWRGEVGEVEDVSRELLEKYDLISKNIPEQYQLLLKVHPLLYRYIKDNRRLVDIIVPDELDVCEMMSTVDLLITDYSSIFIDFLVKEKPIILYQYDQEDYLRERGMYFEMNDLSIPLAASDEEMIDILHNIENISTIYKEKDKFVYTQNGFSSKKIVDNFLDENDKLNIKCVNNMKDNVLIYCSNPESYKLNFINDLSNNKDSNVLLWFSGKIDQEAKSFIESLDKDVKVFFEWDSMLFTQYEWCEYQYYMSNGNHYELEQDLKQIFEREVKRSFSEISFKEVYYLGDLKSKHYLSLIALGLDCPKFILYNSIESILEYQKTVMSDSKVKEVLQEYQQFLDSTHESNLSEEKIVNTNPQIMLEDVSYEVISLSEQKAFLIPSTILKRQNIVLIFRNNKGKQLQNLIFEFFKHLYNADKNYIIYANLEIQDELEDYPNIYFVPNNINAELFLSLLGNEEIIINFSNPVTDKKLSKLIDNKNDESILFNYDPSQLLTYLSDKRVMSIGSDQVYALEVKSYLLEQQVNSLVEHRK